MTENIESLEKLQFEMQTVEAEVKARRKAFKKLERETLAQIRELDLSTQHHTALMNFQTAAYQKYTGLIKDAVEDLNSLLRHMIAYEKGEGPDLTAQLIEKLQLKLLTKAKAENAAMVDLNYQNEKLSDQVPEHAQSLLDHYNEQKAQAEAFALAAQKRVKELEESMNRIKDSHGN